MCDTAAATLGGLSPARGRGSGRWGVAKGVVSRVVS
jgi:hypothetical protein